MKRPTARALTALVLGIALIAAACSSGGDGDHAMDERASSARGQLRDDMREVWEDHVTWTRVVIISAAADLPDYQAAVGRLLQNQDEIGNAIKPYYGEAAGTELTRLLKDHIAIAGDLLVAARESDTAAVGDANTRWYANADDIARFLAKANPDHWPEREMTRMMRTHLDLTLEEATARLSGDWAGDVVAYDRVVAEILEMADMLTDGIIAQFPERFA
jgi:hypothetical protein